METARQGSQPCPAYVAYIRQETARDGGKPSRAHVSSTCHVVLASMYCLMSLMPCDCNWSQHGRASCLAVQTAVSIMWSQHGRASCFAVQTAVCTVWSLHDRASCLVVRSSVSVGLKDKDGSGLRKQLPFGRNRTASPAVAVTPGDNPGACGALGASSEPTSPPTKQNVPISIKRD